MLRLAAVLHVLFSFFKGDTNPDTGDILDDSAITNDGNIPDDSDTISEAAVQAAIDFTQLSCQQTAYIAGRGVLEEEIQRFDTSNSDKIGMVKSVV